MIIHLSSGHSAMIDDEDFEIQHEVGFKNGLIWRGRIRDLSWYPSHRKHTTYVRAKVDGITILLHRAVMNATAGQFIDHRDSNGLNCHRHNLRFATLSQNNHHSRRDGKHTRGVTYDKGRYVARMRLNGSILYLGLFPTEAEAQAAYNAAAIEHFGEFAKPVLTEAN